jgi:integrase
MYLLDISKRLTIRELDGGSPKVIASDLSHFVRFCYEISKNLWELYDDDFHCFVEKLIVETELHDPTIRKRNNNTVGRIIDNTIAFLRWLQETIVPDRILVGPRNRNPQIRLVVKQAKDRHGGLREVMDYQYRPASDTPDPKRPMARAIRNKLWDGIAVLAESEKKRINSGQLNEELEAIDYLRARRELQLLLCEATGRRPGELARLKIGTSPDFGYREVSLPTLKRRKAKDPITTISLELGVAIKLGAFVERHRQHLIEALRKKGINAQPLDHVFLNARNGSPLTETSLTKDFQRIAAAAGIRERACMSMFRHRFITLKVATYLRAFLEDNSGKSRMLLTEADYISVLKRVAIYTGHADPESLLPYIDMAWDEIGAFDGIEAGYVFCQSIENAMLAIRSLQTEISAKHLASEDVIQRVMTELNSIQTRTLEVLRTNSEREAA